MVETTCVFACDSVQTLKNNTEVSVSVSCEGEVTGGSAADTTPILQREISTQTPTPVCSVT